MKSIIKRLVYYFTAFCFLFTGTVVPALLGMKVFANDIDATETAVYDSSFVDSDTSEPIIPLAVDTPKELTNAVDSVKIVRNDNTNEVLFEWRREGNTTRLSLDKVDEASSWRLTAEWSVKDADAKAGDYFTVEIPLGGVFDPRYLSGSGEIRNALGELTATYEIIPKGGGKEVKITLTDYVERYGEIKGDFWCVLFVGYVDETTFKTIQLVVNDIMIISDDIQVIARPNDLYYPTSDYAKWVTSGPSMKITDSVTGKEYYYFSWMLVINRTFGEIDNFYFRDEIRQNSPHVFVTGSTLNSVNGTTITLSDNDYARLSKMTVTEYISADNAMDEDEKKQIYLEHYNNGYWTHPSNIHSYSFQNERSYPGYSPASESGDVPGIFVSDFELGEKGFSANLGRVTRPMYIQYYTIATQEFTEGDLIKNSATANTISNIFYPMERIIQSERIHGFQENHGGSANGITGGLSFSFQKISAEGEPLEGAWFELFADFNCSGTPLRKAMSDEHGTVAFDNIKEGTYYIKETSSLAGYMLSDTIYMVTVDSGGCNIYDGFDFTRELTGKVIVNYLEGTLPPPATINISGTKIWVDGNSTNRPASITVNLLRNGIAIDAREISYPWTYEFSDLLEYDPKTDEQYIYTVRENAVPGYTPTYNDGINYDITNTFISIDISVTKKWNDADNQDGNRPDSVTVQLFANDSEEGNPVALNEDNNWAHTWRGLSKYDAEENEIQYMVEETAVAGYTPNIISETENDSVTITITNSYKPKTTSVSITKEWSDTDNQDGFRPNNVTVRLLADGVEIIGSVTLNADNNWKYTWVDLPEYKNGAKINYTVKEAPVDRYTASYSNDGNAFTITNVYTPGRVNKTVLKVWDDDNDCDKLRPMSIEVQLYADGTTKNGSVTLNADNNWQYTWESLPEKNNGEIIIYTVKEIMQIPGYIAVYSEDTFIITNKHTVIFPETPNIPADDSTAITTTTSEAITTSKTPPPATTSVPPTSSEPLLATDDSSEPQTTDPTEPSIATEPPTVTTSATAVPSASDSAVPVTVVETSTLDYDFDYDDAPNTMTLSEDNIPAASDKHGDSNVPSPKTGDITPLILLSIISLSAFAFLMIARKRAWIKF